MLEKFYKEAVTYGVVEYMIENGYAIFYKGFKLTKMWCCHNKLWLYTLENIRDSDFYTAVPDKIILQMYKNGFIKTADDFSYTRNKKRVKRYKRKLEKLYNQKRNFKNPNTHKSKNYLNILALIAKNVDLVQIYSVRMYQHEYKYNLETT